MDIVTYEANRKAEWDGFVTAHALSSYGHHSALFTLAEISGASNHSLMLYDERRLQAVLPLVVTRYRDLRAVPLVTLRSGYEFPAGPLFSATSSKVRERHQTALMREAFAVAEREGCDRIRIGYPTVVGEALAIDHYRYLPVRELGFTETNVISLVLDFARAPDFERIAAYACRQSIRRAEEIGAQIELISDAARWASVYELNVQTMDDLAYSREQLQTIWREFIEPGFATAFAAVVDGAIASVIVSIHARTSSYYWLGFNRRPPMRGTAHLAMAAAIRHAQQRGARFFELGSKEFTNARQVGISRFKESFGGLPCYAIDGVLERKPMKKLALDAARLAITVVRRPAARPPVAVGEES